MIYMCLLGVLVLSANSFRYLEIEHGFDIGGHVHGFADILPYVFGIFKIYAGKIGMTYSYVTKL